MNRQGRVFTPQISRKRREREEPSFLHGNRGNNNYAAARSKQQTTSTPNTTSSKPLEPISSNRLLAGYMAYEFLTKGTLLGQKFDPALEEAVPVAASEPKKKLIQSVNNNNNNNNNSSSSSSSSSGNSESASRVGAGAQASVKKSSAASKPLQQSYAEVANLLKTDGAHISGIVNPTQLARWIQM
ncbi:hypothetical protein Ancab_013077 [Ancistrocladus abbreviatus]